MDAADAAPRVDRPAHTLGDQQSTTPPLSVEAMSRTLIIIGLVIVVVGLLGRWLGRLPGDIVIERGSFTFYAPIATSLLISLVVCLILWLFNR